MKKIGGGVEDTLPELFLKDRKRKTLPFVKLEH